MKPSTTLSTTTVRMSSIYWRFGSSQQEEEEEGRSDSQRNANRSRGDSGRKTWGHRAQHGSTKLEPCEHDYNLMWRATWATNDTLERNSERHWRCLEIAEARLYQDTNLFFMGPTLMLWILGNKTHFVRTVFFWISLFSSAWLRLLRLCDWSCIPRVSPLNIFVSVRREWAFCHAQKDCISFKHCAACWGGKRLEYRQNQFIFSWILTGSVRIITVKVVDAEIRQLIPILLKW